METAFSLAILPYRGQQMRSRPKARKLIYGKRADRGTGQISRLMAGGEKQEGHRRTRRPIRKSLARRSRWARRKFSPFARSAFTSDPPFASSLVFRGSIQKAGAFAYAGPPFFRQNSGDSHRGQRFANRPSFAHSFRMFWDKTGTTELQRFTQRSRRSQRKYQTCAHPTRLPISPYVLKSLKPL